MYTTQREIRRAFWSTHRGIPGISSRRIPDYSGSGMMHNTDTRCAFADFVDSLERSGQISSALAARATLD